VQALSASAFFFSPLRRANSPRVKTKNAPLWEHIISSAEREGFSSLAELSEIQNKSARKIVGLPILYPQKTSKIIQSHSKVMQAKFNYKILHQE